MSEADLEAIIKRAAQGAISEFMASKDQQCRCSLDMRKHKEHHEFISELVLTMRRWNAVRWGMVQALVIALALGVVALIGLGINDKLGG